jgi:hypothetical protein
MNGSAPDSARQFWQALGPGLLFAGAAVGVSHLVQSTRAGAGFGLALLGVVILANIFKYPAFSFGPRYAAATGTSLLEGYRRQGRWTLILFHDPEHRHDVHGAGCRDPSSPQRSAPSCSAGLRPTPIFGFPQHAGDGGALDAALRRTPGHRPIPYRWLDRIIKVVVVALTLTTLLSAALLLPQLDYGTVRILPSAEMMADKATVPRDRRASSAGCPPAFDISIWSSLWTLEKHKAASRPTRTFVARCWTSRSAISGTRAPLLSAFLVLGAGVMHGSGESFSSTPHVFAGQIIDLYARSPRRMEPPRRDHRRISTVMFSRRRSPSSTAGHALYPPSYRTLFARPKPSTAIPARIPYWIALLVMAWGSLTVIPLLPRLAEHDGRCRNRAVPS